MWKILLSLNDTSFFSCCPLAEPKSKFIAQLSCSGDEKFGSPL